ncbi:MAG: hypothetical protein K2P14_06860 [Anaeroplasmataceae bacterium]|jgi:hypothetical protein|nr:hypothetical protein [Anaeroplasmataceae bacterium]
MEYIEDKEIIVIFNKRMGLDTVASKLALLNGEQIKKFFMERTVKIPRKLNAMALTSALNESIKMLNSHSLTKDAFSKLENYANYTEFQLQNLFEKIGSQEDYFLYRKNLWKLLIRNHIGINLLDGEVTRLINTKKYAMDSFINFEKAIFEVTLDLAKEFDAYPASKFEELLKLSFSQEEIRILALKYGFDIPARLKKDDLLQYVRAMMKARRKLTLALQRELKDMTIVQLNTFCQLQNLGISSNMKKEELIALFLFLARQAKFPKIEAKNLLGMSFTMPLKFRVDMDVIDNFKRGVPKKVILLEEEEQAKLEESLEELEIKETPKKRPSKDDMISDIIKKLLPYLNIDEDTARLAISHGIDLKLKTKETPATKKTAATPQKKKK